MGHWFQGFSQTWWCEIKFLAHCFPRSNANPWSWDVLTQSIFPRQDAEGSCGCFLQVPAKKLLDGPLTVCLYKAHALRLRFSVKSLKHTGCNTASILLCFLSPETHPHCCTPHPRMHQQATCCVWLGRSIKKPTSSHISKEVAEDKIRDTAMLITYYEPLAKWLPLAETVPS